VLICRVSGTWSPAGRCPRSAAQQVVSGTRHLRLPQGTGCGRPVGLPDRCGVSLGCKLTREIFKLLRHFGFNVSVALHRVNWGRVSARKRDVTGNRNEMTTRVATGASADVAFTVFNNAVSIDVIIFPKPSVHPYGVRVNGLYGRCKSTSFTQQRLLF
jgi:hypothetical protein